VCSSDLVTYDYDDDGVLDTAGAMTITRDPNHGLVTDTDLPVGTHHVTDHVTYTPFGEPKLYTASRDGSALFQIDHTSYDSRGRLRNKTETINGVARLFGYAYDAADRLSSYSTGLVGAPFQIFTYYTYDANGNRTATAGTWSVDAQDRLLTSPFATYTYTPNGELRTRTVSGQITTYSYDLFGNLRLVDRPAPSADITYGVDALNRRVSKSVGGVLERAWAYDGDRVVAELDASGNVVSRFIYGVGSYVPDYMTKGGGTYRLIKDHLGSVRVVVNVATGVIAQQLAYDPWGKVLSDTGAKFQPFGFAGGLYDPDTSLVRFGARDYDPETGRWTTKDPVGFAGGVNLYAYVDGDPVNRIDPTGEVGWVAIGVAGGAVVGGLLDVVYQLHGNGGNWSQVSWVEVGVAAGAGAWAGYGIVTFGPGVASALGAGAASLGSTLRSCGSTASSGLPRIRSAIGQGGFRDPGSIDKIKADMLAGTFRYGAPEGRIAGIVDANGTRYITEGHHRMAAAQELGRSTGNWSYVQQLLDNGLFRRGTLPPISGSMPSRGWW